MPEGNHFFIDIDRLGSIARLNIDGRQCSSMAVYAVLFQQDVTPSNQFDETIFCSITPRLILFRAVNRIQTNVNFVAGLRYDNGVAINDILNLCLLIILFRFRFGRGGLLAFGRGNKNDNYDCNYRNN